MQVNDHLEREVVLVVPPDAGDVESAGVVRRAAREAGLAITFRFVDDDQWRAACRGAALLGLTMGTVIVPDIEALTLLGCNGATAVART